MFGPASMRNTATLRALTRRRAGLAAGRAPGDVAPGGPAAGDDPGDWSDPSAAPASAGDVLISLLGCGGDRAARGGRRAGCAGVSASADAPRVLPLRHSAAGRHRRWGVIAIRCRTLRCGHLPVPVLRPVIAIPSLPTLTCEYTQPLPNRWGTLVHLMVTWWRSYQAPWGAVCGVDRPPEGCGVRDRAPQRPAVRFPGVRCLVGRPGARDSCASGSALAEVDGCGRGRGLMATTTARRVDLGPLDLGPLDLGGWVGGWVDLGVRGDLGGWVDPGARVLGRLRVPGLSGLAPAEEPAVQQA